MKRAAKLLGVGLIFMLLLSSIAMAQPQSIPNGPYVEREQNVSFSSFMTNEELADTLKKIEASSKGKMELEVVGYSNAINGDLMEEEGFPLYVAKFGGADDPNKKRVLITTQIHGNEPLGTEAMVELMKQFAGSGKEFNEILDNVTVWFMPRINPDGAMNEVEGKWSPQRRTHQLWDPEFLGLPAGTEAPWYYRDREKGYDENRDYNPNLDFRPEDFITEADTEGMTLEQVLNNGDRNNSDFGGFYVTPESRIVTKVFKELDPDVYFDIHHRGFNTVSEEDIRSVPIQIAAVVADPYTDPFTGNEYEVDDSVLKLGKQINVVGYQAIQRGFSHYGAIQKYPDVNLPGTSLGAFALNDTAIMLIEIKGQSGSLGQKQNGMLKQTAKVPVYEILKSLADGSVSDVDESLYDDIPESSNRMRDPSTME
ncbi:hypothetical protein MFMK1_003004 [Metallumcola ferriviriculae]|uniref:Peptidase M14 domain-containing protein n=1 Tax=Metallumcola ferriviriculae TaxID=3039180 RepID=A0AAU0UQD8_9FIRM|nr:hypothetical protein MFMK1_003004 [Desulfitibacteraceae bacterium MK1]